MSVFSFLAATAASGQFKAAGEVAGAGSTIYGILYFIFMTAVILGAAYYVTRFIAKRGFGASGNKNIKVVESISLGIDKSLLLVKVGEQYMLLGSTQKSISLLAEIDKDKLAIENAGEVYSGLDDEGVEAYMNGMNVKEKAGLSSVKQNLDKLKSIVRGNKIDG
ncbi:MAG TPA: flagellar biosynthetic protein FliO [Negativicutes bacterium]|nr:flagellar biosynthetic protein FliO [Negativicutes bacterium]